MADNDVRLTEEQQGLLEGLILELEAAAQSTEEVSMVRPIPWPVGGRFCVAPLSIDATQRAELADVISEFRGLLEQARGGQPIQLAAAPRNVSGRVC